MFAPGISDWRAEMEVFSPFVGVADVGLPGAPVVIGATTWILAVWVVIPEPWSVKTDVLPAVTAEAMAIVSVWDVV